MEGFGLEAEARMTTWHVMMPTENEADGTHSHDVSEGETLLSVLKWGHECVLNEFNPTDC